MSKQDIPFRNIIGRFEIIDFQTKIFFVLVVISLVVGMGILFKENQALREANANLRETNIMYGYPNQDGVFVSSKSTPEGHIRAFVESFTNNFFNYDHNTISPNISLAKSMMCPGYRLAADPSLEQNEKSVKNNRIEQVTAADIKPGKVRIERDKAGRGYEVTFNAKSSRSTLNKIYLREAGTVSLVLVRVKPSATYEWGLQVCGISTNMKEYK